MACLKANAYGHGIIEIAKTLHSEQIDYYGVAFPEEGVLLRQAGISTPILVLGAHLGTYLKVQLDNNLDITVTHFDQLEQLQKLCSHEGKTAQIHLKVDTGMNRVGFSIQDFFKALKEAISSKELNIIGVYSHLSSSDEKDLHYTQEQIKRFAAIRDQVKENHPEILFHLANSGAIMQHPNAWFDMVRPGTLLFGNPPSVDFNGKWKLKEVMSFHSKITLIKIVGKNEAVSYNRSFYTRSKTKIAVVPVGYGDGYTRNLSNNSFVLVNGRRHPVVGAVCMDQTLVDLGLKSPAKIGDDVVLFGRQQNEHISIREVAKNAGTIPYEVTCLISSRVERIHLNFNN
jgi:alanine racemase